MEESEMESVTTDDEGSQLVIAIAEGFKHVIQQVKGDSSKEGVALAACITTWLETGEYDKTGIPEKLRPQLDKILKGLPPLKHTPGNVLPAAQATLTWFQMASNYARNLGVITLREALVICGAQLLRKFVESVAQLSVTSASYAGAGIATASFAMLLAGIFRDEGKASKMGVASRLAGFFMCTGAVVLVVFASLGTGKGRAGVGSSLAKVASRYPGYFSLCFVKDLAFYLFPSRNNVLALPVSGTAVSALLYGLMQWLLAGYGSTALEDIFSKDPSAYAMLGGIAIGTAGVAAFVNTVVDVIDDASAPHILRHFQTASQQELIAKLRDEQDTYVKYESYLMQQGKAILKEKKPEMREAMANAVNQKMYRDEHARLQAMLQAGRPHSYLEDKIYSIVSEEVKKYNDSSLKWKSPPASVLAYGENYKKVDVVGLDGVLYVKFKDVFKGQKVDDKVLLGLVAEYYVDAVIESYMPLPPPDLSSRIRRKVLKNDVLLPLALRREVNLRAQQDLDQTMQSLHDLTRQSIDVIWKQDSGKWEGFLTKFTVTNPMRMGFYIFLFTFLEGVSIAVESIEDDMKLHVIYFFILPTVFGYYFAFYQAHDTKANPKRRIALPNASGSKTVAPAGKDEDRTMGEAAAKSTIDAIYSFANASSGKTSEDASGGGVGSKTGTSSKLDAKSSGAKSSSTTTSSSSDVDHTKPGGVDNKGGRSNPDCIYFEAQVPNAKKCAVHVANMMIAYEDQKAALLPLTAGSSSKGDDIADLQQHVEQALSSHKLKFAFTTAVSGSNGWSILGDPDLEAVGCIGITYAIQDVDGTEHVHSVMLAKDKRDPQVIYLLDPRAGHQGTGKTTMAKALRSLLNGKLLPRGASVKSDKGASLLYGSKAQSHTSTPVTTNQQTTTSTANTKPVTTTSTTRTTVEDACRSGGLALFVIANGVFEPAADVDSVIGKMAAELKKNVAQIQGVSEWCLKAAVDRYGDDGDAFLAVRWLIAEAVSRAEPKLSRVAELQEFRDRAQGLNPRIDMLLGRLGANAV